MINTKIVIDSVDYTEYTNMRVNKSISTYNSSSDFTVRFPSPFGRHATSFSVGQEIVIYSDDSDATTKLFTGTIEKIKFNGMGNTQTVTLSGRDYSAKLQDITIEPIVYSNSEISTIVTNILSQQEIIDITTTNVDVTTTTLQRMSFNQQSIFDAYSELAELAGFIFYVDENKDLHFEKKEFVSSGQEFNNTNITSSTFNNTREGMANRIWVYGDRYLSGFREELSAGSPVGGSVFTLLSKPHNTSVDYLGNIQRGGVFELISEAESGTNYLVSFEDRQLIFTSGTTIGDSIPISGGSIVASYDREIPIAKVGTNWTSLRAYGQKNKIITDTAIKDPTTASDILQKELDKSDPFRGVEINVSGWYDLTTNQTVKVVLSDFNIDEVVGILNITYSFDKNRVNSEDVIKIRLDKKITDLTDELSELRRRLDRLEAKDRVGTDVLTRLEVGNGSFAVVGSYWEVKSRYIGSDYIWGNPSTGPTPPWSWGSGLWQGEHFYPNLILPVSIGSLTSCTWASGNLSTNDKCIQFNGSNSNIECENIGSPLMYGPNPGSAWTISAWVNTVGSSLNGSVSQCICTQDRVGDTNYLLIGDREHSRPFDIELGLDDSRLSVGQNIVVPNQWNHIAATCYLRDVGSPYVWEGKIYYNGSVVQSGNKTYQTGEKPTATGNGYIGWDERYKAAFNGRINDLRFYSEILDQSDITKLYNNEPVNDNLQAAYSMDEGSGNYTYSTASGLNNGYETEASGGYY